MDDLPQGTVTFVFTDVVGSSRLWEREPATMRAALVRHDVIVETTVRDHGGVVVRPRGEGDSRFAVFRRATDALVGAMSLQRILLAEPWPTQDPLRVRAGVHTGDADLSNGDYYGPAVNRCARLRGLAHGGQVLVSQAAAHLSQDHLPAGLGLRPLGIHRLRDLQRPEQVFQLEHADLPADFPPLRSLDTFPNNLPTQLTSLIGRDEDVEHLKTVLLDHRLVTVTGSAGCGKTRLAEQVAADMLDAFADGVWLVELGALSEPGLVAQKVAAVLGLREQPGRAILATIIDDLQSRQLLLVLDNCEHLIEACAYLTDALLRACPHVRVLASSREALGVAGEIAWRVPSLPLPLSDERPSADRLLRYEAIRLFVERASAALPSFRLDDGNAAAVAGICRRLDGIPLAIELAAARVTVLPVDQIAARLHDRFSLLTRGHRTSLPRQQTLRATMDWSHDLLPPRERTLFRRLAVFANGWTLGAAEAICADDGLATGEVLDLLARLVDKSLVMSAAGELTMGEARYWLLETVREYAGEKLAAAGEDAAVRRRHRDWFLQLVQEAEPGLRTGEQERWILRLAAELDNIRAALEWSRTDEAVPEARLQLTGSLWWFWYTQGTLHEARTWLEHALATTPPARTPHRAGTLYGAAAIASAQGDVGRAADLAGQALDLCREFDDRLGIIYCLAILSVAALLAGRHEEAGAMLKEAQSLAPPDDRWLRAMIDGMLSWAAYYRGDLDQAVAHAQDSLAGFRGVGDSWGAGSILAHLGRAVAASGDLNRGRLLLTESVALTRRLGNRLQLAMSLHELAKVEAEARRLDEAEAAEREALSLRQEQGDRPGIAECLEGLGRLARLSDAPTQAVRHYAGAAAIRDATGLPVPPADARRIAGDLLALQQALGADAFNGEWAAGYVVTGQLGTHPGT